MHYDKILKEIYEEVNPVDFPGAVASYIPELASVDPQKFGMCLITADGKEHAEGDCDTKFSVQSISKVFSLTMALGLVGDKVWNGVGVEPSGNPFNSLVQLESEKGVPRNPFINAGAMVVADILVSELKDPKNDFLEFVREITHDKTVNFNLKVAASEQSTGYRNYALANFLKSFGRLKNDPDTVLDFYFHQCSLEMNCRQLAKAFLVYSHHGNEFKAGNISLTKSQVKRINAVMLSCGFYDESGEFAFKVGLPGKSGVGGGIAAVHPGYYSVVAWSPKLNEKGNSEKAMRALELLTDKTGKSIF
ncbi:MAG TPA: glutaminase [Flavobacteriales bacterium]|nr:glutaminase [Flavobacteriales bacterium]